MQQHHEISAALGKMELAMRVDSAAELLRSLDELAAILGVHQPAEEEKVFPLVSSVR